MSCRHFLDLDFSNIETHVEDTFAWAIADLELTAVVNKDQRPIRRRGDETFLSRRIGADRKVVHIQLDWAGDERLSDAVGT